MFPKEMLTCRSTIPVVGTPETETVRVVVAVLLMDAVVVFVNVYVCVKATTCKSKTKIKYSTE